MSSFKKALRMLQSGNDVNPAEQEPRAQLSSESATTEMVQQSGHRHSRSRGPTRYLSVGGVADERVPDFSISVSLETLRNHGLIPQDADIDLVAQQFRRIKRPILNTAFGLGIAASGNANIIMLASALPKSGKSFCSFNLATSIARERGRQAR